MVITRIPFPLFTPALKKIEEQKMTNIVYPNKEIIDKISLNLSKIKVCTIGDICLDFYLYADMKLSELSRETPHYPLPVVKEVASPGGGGNVINNIMALKPGKLTPVSIIGNDWRGFMLEKYFKDNGFDTSYILKSESFITNCYCKPMRMGISDVIYEDPRLDFENREPLGKSDEEKLIEALDEAIEGANILVVSDQMANGIITPAVRKRISEIAEKIPVIVDSRDRAGLYENVIVKPNEVEAAMLIGRNIKGLDLSTDELVKIGVDLQKKNNRPVIVTLGSIGSLWCDDSGTYLAPTVKAEAPVDICGAGDTFMSAFACAYACGVKGQEAVAFANLASGVTVKKIGTTGTASIEEINQKYSENFENDK